MEEKFQVNELCQNQTHPFSLGEIEPEIWGRQEMIQDTKHLKLPVPTG